MLFTITSQVHILIERANIALINPSNIGIAFWLFARLVHYVPAFLEWTTRTVKYVPPAATNLN